MGTVRDQVSADSVDPDGLSVVTTTRTVDGHPRAGMIYSPLELAAVAPIHFHPLSPGRHLMVFSPHWRNATVSESDPGLYLDDYAEDRSPGWAIVTGTGSCSHPGRSYLVPGPEGRALVGACSQSNSYLYLLSSYGMDGALIEHHQWVPARDAMSVVATEQLGPIEIDEQPVRFDGGIYLDGAHLVVVGVGTLDQQIYLARKPWGRIGTNRVVVTKGKDSDRLDDPSWTYQTEIGWDKDPAAAVPIGVSTYGPVSVVIVRDRYYMATVEASEDVRLGRIYTRRNVERRWTPLPETVDLGAITEPETYCGGTVQFQPMLSPVSFDSAMPYVVTRRITETLEDEVTARKLSVEWDTWPL